jgi:ferritin-like metal-binding protein YciE
MASEPKTLNDLFLDTLKDLYYAEKADPEGIAENGEGRQIARAQAGLREAS